MRKSKKAFMFMLMVCLMAVSIAMPATAAEVPAEVPTGVQDDVPVEAPQENHEIWMSEDLGGIVETLTFKVDGKNITEEVIVNLVPINFSVEFNGDKETSAVLFGYRLEKGILSSETVPWSFSEPNHNVYKGSGYSYYEVRVHDNTDNVVNYYFKPQEKNGVDQLDAWAKAEVDEAIEAGLIPSGLQNKYKEKITRADFSKLIVNYVEWYMELTIDEVLEINGLSLENNPFTDTSSEEVIAANKLGIVNGKGNGKFDPNGSITRQEAATMLTKTAEALDYEVKAKSTTYADSSSIATWAKAGVDFVSFYGIMNGTGKDSFSPKGTYTRQQAYLTIARLDSALE